MSKLETRPSGKVASLGPHSEPVRDLKTGILPVGQAPAAEMRQALLNGLVQPLEPIHDEQSAQAVGSNEDIYFNEISQIPLLTAEQEIKLAKQLEAGTEARTRLFLAEQPITDTEALEETARRGDEARRRLIESNLRLVVSVARNYQGLGLPLLDMVQEGNIGLQRAVEKFDWRRGFRFSTYAYWWIRQALTRGIAEQARAIRLPVHQTDLLRMLNNIERDLSQQLGREPTDKELAKISGLSLDRVEELHRVSQFTGSLDVSATPEGDPLGDLVPDMYSPTPEEEAEKTLLRDYIYEALQGLPPREQAVLRLRFGLEDGKQRTLAEVADGQGLSRERVRQIERDALGKLRHSRVRLKLREYIE